MFVYMFFLHVVVALLLFKLFLGYTPSSFITGSQVYGSYGTYESDVDLVCYFDENDWGDFLWALGIDPENLSEECTIEENPEQTCYCPFCYSKDEYFGFDGYKYPSRPIRIGNLNIIPSFRKRKNYLWRVATSKASLEKPKTKRQAIKIFDEVFGGKNR